MMMLKYMHGVSQSNKRTIQVARETGVVRLPYVER